MKKFWFSSEHILISQMTLWSMAKSPLMYGGDLRQLDDWTYGLITNPTLLSINSLSATNQEAREPSLCSCSFLFLVLMVFLNSYHLRIDIKLFLPFWQFPHITSLNNDKIEGHDVVAKVPSTPSLVLTACTDPKASGWSSEKYNQNLERICYKKNLEKDQEPFCAYKIGTPTSSL